MGSRTSAVGLRVISVLVVYTCLVIVITVKLFLGGGTTGGVSSCFLNKGSLPFCVLKLSGTSNVFSVANAVLVIC